jgi:hypothetical protein
MSDRRCFAHRLDIAGRPSIHQALVGHVAKGIEGCYSALLAASHTQAEFPLATIFLA